MKTIFDVLDNAHEYVLGGSDYSIAKTIGASKQEVSNWRNGRGAPNAYYCARLADLMGEDLDTIQAIVGAEWEKKPERRDYWKEKLGHAASFALPCLLYAQQYILC